MVEARSREAWDHTALVACMVANANRDPKAGPIPLARFHPHLQRVGGGAGKDAPAMKVGVKEAKGLLLSMVPQKPKPKRERG